MPTVNVRDTVSPARNDANLRSGWQALTLGAGAVRLSDFGVLKIEGSDRASWLHKLVTANVEAMRDGDDAYSLLLEAKGHVLADFVLLKQPDSFLLYTSRAAFDILVPNLRLAIFREKVTLTDLTDQFGLISLQGPVALVVALKIFDNTPDISISQFRFKQLTYANHELFFVRHSRASVDGFDFLVSSDESAGFWDALLANGARPVELDALNVARVEASIPWFGADFDETTLALEARLDASIADNKGCYPGQEVIARIRNLGHVNRLLVQFQIDGETVPSRGDAVFVDEKEAGSITSAVWSFAHNAPLALGYVRREWAIVGTHVQIVRGMDRLNAMVA